MLRLRGPGLLSSQGGDDGWPWSLIGMDGVPQRVLTEHCPSRAHPQVALWVLGKSGGTNQSVLVPTVTQSFGQPSSGWPWVPTGHSDGGGDLPPHRCSSVMPRGHRLFSNHSALCPRRKPPSSLPTGPANSTVEASSETWVSRDQQDSLGLAKRGERDRQAKTPVSMACRAVQGPGSPRLVEACQTGQLFLFKPNTGAPSAAWAWYWLHLCSQPPGRPLSSCGQRSEK